MSIKITNYPLIFLDNKDLYLFIEKYAEYIAEADIRPARKFMRKDAFIFNLCIRDEYKDKIGEIIKGYDLKEYRPDGKEVKELMEYIR